MLAERRAARVGEVPLLKQLEDFRPRHDREVIKTVYVRELETTMLLDEDIRTPNGQIIVPRGRAVDWALVKRLRNFAGGVGLVKPIRVRIPAD